MTADQMKAWIDQASHEESSVPLRELFVMTEGEAARTPTIVHIPAGAIPKPDVGAAPTSEPVVYVCSLPGTPLSYNDYISMLRTPGGQRKADRIEAKSKSDFFYLLGQKGNVVPTGFARVELRTVIFFPLLDADCKNRGDRRHDGDNYHMPHYKWIQDVLVARGVIPDDRERCCTSHPVRFTRGREPMTLLTMDLYATLAQEVALP